MPRDFTHSVRAAASREVIERELARQASRSANTGAETDFRLTRDDIRAAIRDADDDLISELIEAGATLQEFSQAFYWMSNPEAARNAGKPSPSGRIARVLELLQQDFAQRRWM